jgi:hypothetical protein
MRAPVVRDEASNVGLRVTSHVPLTLWILLPATTVRVAGRQPVMAVPEWLKA